MKPIAPITPQSSGAIVGNKCRRDHAIAPIAPSGAGAIPAARAATIAHFAPKSCGVENAPVGVVLVAGGLLVRGGEILLGRRAPHRRICPNTWDMIGGHVEAGEGIEAALIREFGEEIGVRPIDFTPLTVIDFSAEAGRPVSFHAFRIDGWTGTPSIRNDEHVDLRWFALDAACALPDLASAKYPPVFRTAFSLKA